MSQLRCPFTACTYSTEEDLNSAEAVAIIQIHAMTHATPPAPTIPQPTATPPNHPHGKMEKVSRPRIIPGGTTEDWLYFKLRWGDYVRATGIGGIDLTSQLLECCDDSLRCTSTSSLVPFLLDPGVGISRMESIKSKIICGQCVVDTHRFIVGLSEVVKEDSSIRLDLHIYM